MSPTSSRSSSMSSGSRASSKSPPDPAKKKFGCTFPACGKAFSRSEHLHRHALNHKEGNNTYRHMARHKEKDDEAGGEGLGVLATRKRLWRDENGSIVNSRRPTYTQEGAKRRQSNRPARKPSSDEGRSTSSSCSSPHPLTPACLLTPISHNQSPALSTIIVDSGIPDNTCHRPSETQIPHDSLNQTHDSWLAPVVIDSALPSPPFLSPTLHSADQSPSAELSEFDALYEDTTWPHISTQEGLPPLSNSHPSTSTTSPILGAGESSNPWAAQQPFQTFMGAPMGEELPYDDIFKPEPGMYEWQAWNSHVLMSRCREEKADEVGERRREWGAGDGAGYMRQDEEAFRRSFVGMGTC
ncbi:uncharacterized protein BP5553_10421 [Venustampulla echinocandica]|uniref:C2H2-type domain-containing protein n=1 Tax=Venustampulla echinocandica TaxID=2656787 RepID=A0A370T9A2_9HELO|nr:uncharacterized protein BP5553_10421 [Venustampulla echinocandica]RDL30143.1 hypothetical protein BP5553_10421 [Venustampulla echinocandica]